MRIPGAAPCLAVCLAVATGATPLRAEDGFGRQEHMLVVAMFRTLQPRSIALNAELCGYIVRDDAGHLRMTGPILGQQTSCSAPWPEWGEPIASWHTHGAFDPDTFNELPSDIDVMADFEEEIDGWVATPGGRLWHISGDSQTVELICGRGCLPSDPAYDPDETGAIERRYDFEALLERLEE